MSTCYLVGNKAKGQISKRVFQEKKARQIFRIFWKMNISYPLIHKRICAYEGVRNVRFSENLACFVFLLPFCLITDNFPNLRKKEWQKILILSKINHINLFLYKNCMFLTFTLTKEPPRVIYSNKVSIQTHRSKSVSELLEVATGKCCF